MSKKQKRYTVHHPRLAGVVRAGLSAAQRDRHHAYGWLDAPPLPTREGAEPADPEPSVSPAVIDTTADELGDRQTPAGRAGHQPAPPFWAPAQPRKEAAHGCI